MRERPESFVVPEGLDFVVSDSRSDFAVQLKEEIFDCEMVESLDYEMVPVEQAVVKIDLIIYQPRHRLNLHLRQPVL